DDRGVTMTVLTSSLKDPELQPENVHLHGRRLRPEMLGLYLEYTDVDWAFVVWTGNLEKRFVPVRWSLHLRSWRDRQQAFRCDPECRRGGLFASGAGQGPQQQGRDGGGSTDASSAGAGELPTVHMLSFQLFSSRR